MITITPIPAFTDNYLWLLSRGAVAVIVDPGDAAPVLQMLNRNRLQLYAILLTHHHPDHVGGVDELLAAYPVPVYGPAAEHAQIPSITHPLDEGDDLRIDALDLDLQILAVPGHTLGHIAYYAAPQNADPARLFCGDTLFAAGCGRLFEGTPQQMFASLQKFARLPLQTEIYCAHEYTAANLAFAHAVEPDNTDIHAEIERVRVIRDLKKLPSLPTTLEWEKTVNPFLRCERDSIRHSVQTHENRVVEEPVDIFASLRRWKDDFRVAS